MTNNYFYVDGSSLISQIKRVWSKHESYRNRKLVLTNFVSFFVSRRFASYKSDNYKRFVFYFPAGGTEHKEYIIFPDRKVASGDEDDIQILMCGKKVKKLSGYSELETYVSTNYPKM
jgi:hypothetical protein